ncbi:15591_t:CDS:2, partial [Rhizophagus irregularis]
FPINIPYPDIFDFLSLNSGFLPPVVQGKDKHFLSLLHTLEYVNDRLPGYDMHCPSISSEIYDELVCKKCGYASNGREKIVRMVQEKENNTIPEVHAGEMSHTQHKYANVEANGNAKNDIHD